MNQRGEYGPEDICGSPEFKRQQKVRCAIRMLGRRWVLHPVNRARKIPPEIPAFLERRPHA